MRGGQRKGSGRKPGSVKENKKVQFNTRLSSDIIKWLRKQNKPMARVIEHALRKEMKVCKDE